MRILAIKTLLVLGAASAVACGGGHGTSATKDASSPSDAPNALSVGSLVMYGGRKQGVGQTPLYNDTWVLGSSWTELATPTSPPVRDQSTMATLGNTIVLFAPRRRRPISATRGSSMARPGRKSR
jgi:hypothetical protein